MRLICEKESFLKNISAVQRAVGTRSTLPILNNILLEAKEDSLNLMATDLEIAISTRFPAQVEEEGSITFPSKYMLDIVRRLPAKEIQLTVEKGTFIHLNSGKAHFTITGLSSEEFPSFPEIKGGRELNIDLEDLAELVEDTVFACSKDQLTKPELSGVLFVLSSDQVKAVATDASRMAVREMDIQTGLEEKEEILIPARALEELLKIALPEESVKIVLGQNQVEFMQESRRLITRKIQNRFPPWEQVIPNNYEATFLVETEKFREALERCQLIARLVGWKVLLRSIGSSFILTSQAPEVGSVEEELEWVRGDVALEVFFNVNFLLEGLRGIKDEYTFFAYTGREKPLILKPSDEKGYLYLAMPLRV